MLELSVSPRTEKGRYSNKALYKKGLIPAILYGHKIENMLLSVDVQKFEKIYAQAGENTLIKLKIGKKDKEERVILIHDIARDPVSDNFIHVDFYQVKMDEPITAEIPLEFIGESAAVNRNNGLLIKSFQHLVVEALPQELPHKIEVDISSLNTFDDKIQIKDIKIPTGVKIAAEPKDVVISVIPPRTQEELEELEEKPEEKVEEVKEVEKENKKEGEETK